MGISEVKLARANASNDEKLFRLLVASVKDYAIFMLDPEGYILTWNQGAERIKGYLDQEIIGRHFSIFYTTGDYQKNEPQYNLAEALGKGSYESEGLRVRKDGSLFWANVVITALYNEDQQLTGFAKITRDITERKKDEEKKAKFAAELEELNLALKEKITVVVEHQNQTIQKIQEFTFLADSIPQIIWTSQPDGHVDYYNKHWFEYTGMTPEQTQGWGWEPVLHPEDLDNCVKVWTESLKTGKPYEIEYRFKRAGDGSYRWHLGRALPMRNEKYEIIKWFGSCTDIDEYKRALDLERKISQFEDFNRIVAHNLRGPAGNMGTILDLMEHTHDENTRVELLSLLKRSSSGLNQTLEQLMKVLEIRLNRGIPYENCELQDILSGVQNMLTGQIFSKQAVILPYFELQTIRYPKIYLESIFYNMISNALKYARPDVPPEILITARQCNSQVELTFKDNGLGIDLQQHGRDMFKLNKVFHGGVDSKGVGLFITKTQIETFGGSISVKSEPGAGAEFKIVL